MVCNYKHEQKELPSKSIIMKICFNNNFFLFKMYLNSVFVLTAKNSPMK